MIPVRRAISTLQAMGYVVREAPDFEATLKAERERVYAAYVHLIAEDECRCIQCLRETVEGDEADA